MKLSALFQDVEVKGEYNAETEITNVTDDTKKVRRGSAFVCIKGRKTDGHSHIAEAVENGAAVIICEDEVKYNNCVLVEDSRKAYAVMSANFYGNCHRKMTMVGITGTNGKTTTSYVLKRLLESCGHRVGLIGTVCVMIGGEKYPADLTTPNPSDLHRYLMMIHSAGCDACIMEVSSQALAQDRVYSLNFDCAVFTNLSPEHLDYHGDMQSYAEAKSRLMRMSDCCVINSDDSYAPLMLKNARSKCITFSTKGNADFSCNDIKLGADGVKYTVRGFGFESSVEFPMIGFFSVYNSAAALCAAYALGADLNSAVKALTDFGGIEGRMERVANDLGINIYIDFAHTPDSLENALKTLKGVCSGRLITVFGCGGDRDKSKRPVMGEAACRYSDTVFITSDNPRTEKPEAIIEDIVRGLNFGNYFKITDRTVAIRSAVYSARQGDTVLIAGKGHEKYSIIGEQKIYYNEREIIKKLLEDKARF